MYRVKCLARYFEVKRVSDLTSFVFYRIHARKTQIFRAINVWLKKLKTILPKYVTASFHSLYCEKEEMEEGDKQ